MSESLPKLLLRLSEAGAPAILWGRQAEPHFGREFERLLRQRLLVEAPPATEWSVCGNCECGLDARPIQEIDGRLVAVCPLDHRGDVLLAPEDLRSFRIDVGVLVAEIARASGFAGSLTKVSPHIWSLGPAACGRAVFLSLLRADEYSPSCFLLLRTLARCAPVTVLTPEIPDAAVIHFDAAGVHQVTTGKVIGNPPWESSFAIDVSCLQPDTLPGARLIIARSTNAVTFDGSNRPLPAQPYRLLLLLAETVCGGGSFVPTRDIEAHTNRDARDLVRELRDGLAAGLPNESNVRALIANRRSPPGYRLALPVDDIDLRA